jgi:glucose/arabinose dehydrogenase
MRMTSRSTGKTFLALVILSTAILSGCFEDSTATTSLAGVNIQLQRAFGDLSFTQPLAMLPLPSKNNEWLVLEKQGLIYRVVLQEGIYSKQLYLDISSRVNAQYSESGMLGLAVHPQYAQNGEIYVSYTATGSPLISTVSRFTGVAGANPSPDSEQVILQINQPYSNHNGGEVAFGPDGYLYMGFGDGGSGGDPQGNGQNTSSLLGKILRIDVDNGQPYAIPGDNPFADSNTDRREIFAWGLRNPWRWSFDRQNGELWVGDVGQNAWEEIDIVRSGGNYGWNIKEGFHCYATADCQSVANAAKVIDPVTEYSHSEGCSVTGGYVYRGQQIKPLQGGYIFGDYCSGRIWMLSPTSSNNTYDTKLLFDSELSISSFAEDNQGEVYVVHLGGAIYKIVPANP